MSINLENEDLRVKKTYNALTAAIITLLNNRNFKQITVNDICEEALVSRATFYSHFNDKYDLLKYLANNILKNIINELHNFEKVSSIINKFIRENQKILKNILYDANSETIDILHKIIESVICLCIKRKNINLKSQDYIVLSNFCVGGLSELLLWYIKNNFPDDFNIIEKYLYKMMKVIMIWDAEQEETQE